MTGPKTGGRSRELSRLLVESFDAQLQARCSQNTICKLCEPNHITFHKRQMTLSADGDVALEDGSGKQQHFESLNINIANGAFVVLSSTPKLD
jgi:hypothetical protein